ncbi:phosphoglycerate mutase-like protein [Hortaea werneckii]|nr:phosphoglycerate mutase-like protein [Hortaea werneckii]
MAHWTMLSMAVALIALLLYSWNFDGSAALAFGLLDRFGTDRVSQRVLGLNDVYANESILAESGEWDPMHHMGGNSPWFPKYAGTVQEGLDLPQGCRVDQVHMISRHAERYPTVLAGVRMLELYQHLQKANMTFSGDLGFVNDWNFFMRNPAQRFENLVATGAYAGTLEAFATGVKLKSRYEHLLDDALARKQTTFWASGSKRVIETAKYFGAGFFGVDWPVFADLQVIPETRKRRTSTLTPGKSCRKYGDNVDGYGHDYGARMLYNWRSQYLPPIVARLQRENPGISFTEAHVYSMQELCGFETIALGSSPWCGVFTEEELESFEYARDLLHYYKAGPGNPYSGAMGMLWLNATANLLKEGPEKAGSLFLSFVHDGDITPMLSALELFPQSIDLPTTHILRNRTWKTSDVIPMGGRIIFERLACAAPQYCWDNAEFGYPNHKYCTPPAEEYHVRINVNDGIVALPGCEDGPGHSCPLETFMGRVSRRATEVGTFAEICGISGDGHEGLDFLHQ